MHGNPGSGLLVLILTLVIVFIPMIIALARGVSGGTKLGVLLLNLVAAGLTMWVVVAVIGITALGAAIIGLPSLGFASLAWFAAMIWACAAKSRTQAQREKEAADHLAETAAALRAQAPQQQNRPA